jgi:RNA polymerase sigma factor (sigma-70 family)
MAQNNTASDAPVEARMVEGEEQAFAEFAELAGPIFFYEFRAYGVPEADARDLTTTWITNITLKIQEGAFKGGNLRAWLHAVARNQAKNYWRGRLKHDAITFELSEETAESAESEEKEADPVVCTAVAEAESILNEIDRMILELHYSRACLPFTEIAKMFGLKPGTVRARHKRALERMRPILKSKLAGVLARRIARHDRPFGKNPKIAEKPKSE